MEQLIVYSKRHRKREYSKYEELTEISSADVARWGWAILRVDGEGNVTC